MATIKWVESVPSNASLVGRAPTDFKSVWTAISLGMAVEHYWAGTGGGSDSSAGYLRPGGSRAYVILDTGPPTSSQITGRLAMDLNATSLRVQDLRIYESAGTYLVGTPSLDEVQSSAGSNHWHRTAGTITGVATGSGVTVVTFAPSFITAPAVFVQGSSVSWNVGIGTVGTSGFTSTYSTFAGASGTASIYWEALGLVSSASY